MRGRRRSGMRLERRGEWNLRYVFSGSWDGMGSGKIWNVADCENRRACRIGIRGEGMHLISILIRCGRRRIVRGGCGGVRLFL